MDRVRARVEDKRVLALVKAFLKAGVLTETGHREDTTPAPRKEASCPRCWPTSPCRVLDEHFARAVADRRGHEHSTPTRHDAAPRACRTGGSSATPTTSSSSCTAPGDDAEALREDLAPCSPRWVCGCRRRRPGSCT